jgi:hypothetical protein
MPTLLCAVRGRPCVSLLPAFFDLAYGLASVTSLFRRSSFGIGWAAAASLAALSAASAAYALATDGEYAYRCTDLEYSRTNNKLFGRNARL